MTNSMNRVADVKGDALKQGETFPLAPLFLVRIISTLADYSLIYFVPMFVFKHTQSVTGTGLSYLFEWLPRVLLFPLVGALIDRFTSKRIIVCADFCRMMVVFLALLLLNVFGSSGPSVSVPVLVGVASLASLFGSHSFLGAETLMPKYLSGRKLTSAQSLMEGGNVFAMCMGPFVAGMAFKYLNTQTVLAVLAGVYGISFLLSSQAILSPASRDLSSKGLGWVRDLWRSDFGFGRIFSDLKLTGLCLLGFACNFLFGTVMALGPALCKERFGKDESAFGVIGSSLGLVSLAALVLLPVIRKRLTIEQIYKISIFFVISCFSMLPFVKHFQTFSFLLALATAGIVVLNIFVRTKRAEWIDSKILGKVTGACLACVQFSLPLAGSVVALLGSHYAVDAVQMVSATVGLVTVVIAVLILRKSMGPLVPNAET